MKIMGRATERASHLKRAHGSSRAYREIDCVKQTLLKSEWPATVKEIQNPLGQDGLIPGTKGPNSHSADSGQQAAKNRANGVSNERK